MESVIGLRFSGAPVRIVPSGFHAAARADYKPQFRRLSCSSTSLSLPKLETAAATASLSFDCRFRLPLSRSSQRRPLHHIVGPVRCTAAPSGCDENCQQKLNKCRDMLHQLLQCQPDHLADLLKPILAETDHRLYNQIIEIANDELKNSKNHDLALKLLKISEECYRQDLQSRDAIRFKIMEILYSDGKYEEAFDYWVRLCEAESHQMGIDLFPNMQRDLFSSMRKVLECLKGKLPDKNIIPDKLRLINDSLASITDLEEDMPQLLEKISGRDGGFPNFSSSI